MVQCQTRYPNRMQQVLGLLNFEVRKRKPSKVHGVKVWRWSAVGMLVVCMDKEQMWIPWSIVWWPYLQPGPLIQRRPKKGGAWGNYRSILFHNLSQSTIQGWIAKFCAIYCLALQQELNLLVLLASTAENCWCQLHILWCVGKWWSASLARIW